MGLRGRCGKDYKFRYLQPHYILVGRYFIDIIRYYFPEKNFFQKHFN